MVKETHSYGGLFFTSIALPWVDLFLLSKYDYSYKFILVCIILYFANFGSLLPDIDMKSSYISKRIPILAKTLGKRCRHRGFTHSLLCIFILFIILSNIVKSSNNNIVFVAAAIGLLIGYFSHIFLDLFTKEGVEIFYPCKINFYLLKMKTNSKIEKRFCKFLSTISFLGLFLNILLIFNLI